MTTQVNLSGAQWNMSKHIVFKITENGNVLLEEMNGYAASCVEASRALERRLGKADESSRQLTEEYDKPVCNSNEEHIEH